MLFYPMVLYTTIIPVNRIIVCRSHPNHAATPLPQHCLLDKITIIIPILVVKKSGTLVDGGIEHIEYISLRLTNSINPRSSTDSCHRSPSHRRYEWGVSKTATDRRKSAATQDMHIYTPWRLERCHLCCCARKWWENIQPEMSFKMVQRIRIFAKTLN